MDKINTISCPIPYINVNEEMRENVNFLSWSVKKQVNSYLLWTKSMQWDTSMFNMDNLW